MTRRFRLATVRAVSEQPDQPETGTTPRETDRWGDGTGLALGLSLGLMAGLTLLDDIGVGLALGVALGLTHDAYQGRRSA